MGANLTHSNCKKGEGCCNVNNKAVCYDPTKQTCVGDIQLCDRYKVCENTCCTDQQTCNPVKDNDGKIIKMECGPCKNTDTNRYLPFDFCIIDSSIIPIIVEFTLLYIVHDCFIPFSMINEPIIVG